MDEGFFLPFAKHDRFGLVDSRLLEVHHHIELFLLEFMQEMLSLQRETSVSDNAVESRCDPPRGLSGLYGRWGRGCCLPGSC